MADSSTRVAKILLEYEISKQKLSELRAANADVQKDFAAIGTGATQAGAKARFLSQEFGELRERAAKLRDESMDTRAGILGLDTSLRDASTGTVSLAGNLAKVRDEIQKAKEAADDAGPSLDSLTGDESSGGGSTGRGLKRSGEVLSRVGFGEAGRAVSTVGDLADIDKFKQQLSEIPPTALAAGVGLGALTIALDLYTKQQEQARQAALAEIDARQKAISLAATGTQEQIQAELNRLQKQKQINQAIADDANHLFATLQVETAKNLGDAALNIELLAAEAGKAGGEFQAAHDAAKTANDALNSTSTEMNILAQATGLTAQSAEQAAAAEQKLADVRKQLTVFSENASDLKQILDLEAAGNSVDEVQKLSDAKRRDIEVNQIYEQAARDLAKTLQAGSDEYKAAVAEADKYHDAIERDRNFIDRLSQSTYELVGARQKEAETIDAVKKFNDERTKDTDAYLAKITDIETKNAEKLVALAQKKADAEEAALAKLVDRVASLNLAASRAVEDATLKQQRDDADAQLKFQRQQAKDAREHANKLLDIQRDANAKAEDLIAARDFSGLFRLRRDTNITIQRENEQYAQQAQDRIDAFTQERDDRLTNYAREAQDRQIKYNRDIQDAQAQYSKEITAARNNYIKALTLQQQANQAELSSLQNKYNAQQQLLQQSITNELKMIQNGNIARAQLQFAADQALLQQAQQFLQGIFGGTSLSGGLGVPASTNTVNNSNRTVSANFNINGQNAVNIANVVRSQLQYLVN